MHDSGEPFLYCCAAEVDEYGAEDEEGDEEGEEGDEEEYDSEDSGTEESGQSSVFVVLHVKPPGPAHLLVCGPSAPLRRPDDCTSPYHHSLRVL